MEKNGLFNIFYWELDIHMEKEMKVNPISYHIEKPTQNISESTLKNSNYKS